MYEGGLIDLQEGYMLAQTFFKSTSSSVFSDAVSN